MSLWYSGGIRGARAPTTASVAKSLSVQASGILDLLSGKVVIGERYHAH